MDDITKEETGGTLSVVVLSIIDRTIFVSLPCPRRSDRWVARCLYPGCSSCPRLTCLSWVGDIELHNRLHSTLAIGYGSAFGSDQLQYRALGYGVHGSLHASSSAGVISIDRVSGGDIEARSGLGNIDVVLPVPGFSGLYDLRAPFGWKTITVERLATRLGMPSRVIALLHSYRLMHSHRSPSC